MSDKGELNGMKPLPLTIQGCVKGMKPLPLTIQGLSSEESVLPFSPGTGMNNLSLASPAPAKSPGDGKRKPSPMSEVHYFEPEAKVQCSAASSEAKVQCSAASSTDIELSSIQRLLGADEVLTIGQTQAEEKP
jgi:hypothetical protein